MANTNTSATGGPLLPKATPVVLEGRTLNRFIQQFIVGITDLPGEFVRIAFPGEPANVPDIGDAWCAAAVMPRRRTVLANVVHHGEDPDPANQYDEMLRDEELDVACNFYDTGSSGLADLYASRLCDGLAIAQNREPLFLNNLGLITTGDLVAVPTILHQRWQYRVDTTFSLRRRVIRHYPVLNLVEAQATVKANKADSTVITLDVVVEP